MRRYGENYLNKKKHATSETLLVAKCKRIMLKKDTISSSAPELSRLRNV